MISDEEQSVSSLQENQKQEDSSLDSADSAKTKGRRGGRKTERGSPKVKKNDPVPPQEEDSPSHSSEADGVGVPGGEGQEKTPSPAKRKTRRPTRSKGEHAPDEESESEERAPIAITQVSALQRLSIAQLVAKAKELELPHIASMNRSQIVFEIAKHKSTKLGETLVGGGVLEVLPDNYGFLRSPDNNYVSSAEDIYVSPAQIRRFDLRKGDCVYGTLRSPREKEKYFALWRVDTINDLSPVQAKERIPFESLTPLYPEERLFMETTQDRATGRVIDLIAPIGKGQRGLIVAPPRSGKTIILQNIAHAIETNNPEVSLIVLMIDERPEEVTEMKRSVKGEVVASTFDETPDRHVQVAEMVIEKSRRMVEGKKDVVILLDSITRLARAYNAVQPHSGKILSGGFDAGAMNRPKRFFGSARNIENGGSLTILGTALKETESKMDSVIFEEFKGTGNMELVLSRELADRRVWPAIDIVKSGTRKEEILYHPEELERVYFLREAIRELTPIDAMKILCARLKKVRTNAELLMTMKSLGG